jgi:hypothetical protein
MSQTRKVAMLISDNTVASRVIKVPARGLPSSAGLILEGCASPSAFRYPVGSWNFTTAFHVKMDGDDSSSIRA